MAEIDYEELGRKMEEARKQRDREAIAMLKAESLMAQWEKLTAAEESAKQAKTIEQQERQRYTDMLAEALNVKIGMRVERTRKVGFRNGGMIQTKTYEVTRYSLYVNATSLCLWGRTVRKDGTLGDVFEIGTDWKRVTA